MRVYLDHNATSPLRPEAQMAMAAALAAGGNPSSVHAEGRAARRIVEESRGEIAALVGAKSAEIVFTSGGSEANALALRGIVRAMPAVTRLLVGATEHDSILATAEDLSAERANLTVRRLAVDGQGVLNVEALEDHLRTAPAGSLVSVMAANNETGVLAPVEAICRTAKRFGSVVHIDAAQMVGRLPVDFAAIGADLMSISAHKFGGPTGIGALVVRDGVVIGRQVAGGGQELGRRAGTENVPAIAGFGAVAQWTRAHLSEWSRVSALRSRLEAQIMGEVPEAKIYGSGASRLPNTSLIGLPGIAGETQVMALDLAGIAVSSGSACSSGKVKASHVLSAMGVAEAGDAIRISLGPDTADADIEAFLKAWTPFARAAIARRGVHLAA